MDEPKDSPRRKREGVYAAYTIGPVGKQVKIILLDTRYNRDEQTGGTHPVTSCVQIHTELLGEEQWEWLAEQLHESTAQIHIIASSIQVLPRDKPIQEKWVSATHNKCIV
jgi:alkaline phosphatase D